MKSNVFTVSIFIFTVFLSTPINCNAEPGADKPRASRSSAPEAFNPYSPSGNFSLPVGTLKFDILPDGRIVALADDKIFIEKAIGAREFKLIAKIPGLHIGTYGPHFLRISPNGRKIAVGNNDAGDNKGYIWILELPALSVKWFPLNHFDAEWYDNDLLAITNGIFGESSMVSILDTTSSPLSPQETIVIDNIGGASAGITFDKDGNLFTGNGLKQSGPSSTGTIKYFVHSNWIAALKDKV